MTGVSVINFQFVGLSIIETVLLPGTLVTAAIKIESAWKSASLSSGE